MSEKIFFFYTIFFFYDFPTRTLYMVYDRLFVYIIRVHGAFLVPKTAHNALAIARACVCVCVRLNVVSIRRPFFQNACVRSTPLNKTSAAMSRPL